ncbi:DNA repair protein RecN [Rhodobacteraceae bacterium SB2]|jgi:DNA repair protein RecN (Recombination protein N)|nr:DNA repair protein RecN [Paracoccaceae bacterium]OAH08564.1 DNA repair protein RecN [Rhodobacteraceae bacterium SB2]MBT4231240.1 DNA repair protein RecN [Paracoccaceae bacterium]MBT5317527.1 DNA repair protein RecN [Paracoccaceae bacterium]MBT5853932.1 DNA repair protein RecN [Paracoccaceae bacterium]|tara:strand:- start:5754 stop:7406 length:1653 start_codon:yes stop_codon:yes gene_type:complete
MLKGLDIRDILIIDHLELSLRAGLNVLTGETGAGKSILLDSLGFVLGWRGPSDLVRQGAEQGEVSAWFDLPDDHPVLDLLEQHGLPVSQELILRRINGREGRKTAWINDRRVSGELLRKLSEHLVELHGQHDDRGLLNAKGHRNLLDEYGQYGALKAAVAKAWGEKERARKAVELESEAVTELRREEEFLRHAVAELSALDPKPGEADALDAKRRLMQASTRVRADVSKAHHALGREGAEALLDDAQRWLQEAAAQLNDELDAPLDSLSRVMNDLQDTLNEVEACLDAIGFNPHELETLEERLFAMRGLARKHDVHADALADLAGDLEARLLRLDAGADNLNALRAAQAEAENVYAARAAELQLARSAAAEKLDQAMALELAPLKMERAVFETRLTAAAAGPEGIDQIDFCVATNPGAPAGPLGKIASGGELSRFLLALKVCLNAGNSHATLIFDEIDRGVGGATADAVGRRLAELAQSGQVLVVTHSAQVAALGDAQFQVSKHQTDSHTVSRIKQLDREERVDEIARMISGTQVTDAARVAAQTLIAGR